MFSLAAGPGAADQHPEEKPEPMLHVRLAHNLLAVVAEVFRGEESIPGDVLTGVSMAAEALLLKGLKDAGR
ncbi:hypothetical protein F0U59_23415 [Archangium gephyra]|nr:hypothetical protein F0U59_23415 [Archangium gephyra]